jgi:hypothetical protein
MPENERQSDGRRPWTAAWSMPGSSFACARLVFDWSASSEDVALTSLPSSAESDANDPNGKHDEERREGSAAGGERVAAGETPESEPKGRTGAGDEEEVAVSGTGTRVGGVRASCCGLGDVTRVKKPATASRALEREREMLSITLEGSRGVLLGRAASNDERPDSRNAWGSCIMGRRARTEAGDAAAAVGTRGFLTDGD